MVDLLYPTKTRTVLIRLGRPLDYDHFVLPDNITRTKTTRSVRTYTRSLYPTVSTICHTALFSSPDVPGRHHTYITLFDRDLRRTNLFLPVLWPRRPPFTPLLSSNWVSSLLTYPPIGTMSYRSPVTPTSPTDYSNIVPVRTVRQSRVTRLTCSWFLDCPRLVSSFSTSFTDFLTLLTGYELQTLPLPTLDYLSLLLDTDPSPWLQDLDRLEWRNSLTEERGWVVEVLPVVVGQRSVREKEWLEAMKTFGTSAEDGKRIIYRLGSLLLSEHEKLFRRYWRQVFGPPSSLMHLVWKGLSVRASNSL
jgi:hypothetical protein